MLHLWLCFYSESLLSYFVKLITMDEIPDIKQECYNDFVDISNENNEIYIDTPDYINIESLTEVKVKKSNNESKECKSSLKTDKNKYPKDNTSKTDIAKIKKKRTYKPKPRCCEICGKELTSPKGLLVHMRIHTDEKPFKCNHCDKSFRQSGGLSTHLRTHSKEKPYACPVCMINSLSSFIQLIFKQFFFVK